MNTIGHKSTEYLNRVTTFIDRKLSKKCHHEEIAVFLLSLNESGRHCLLGGKHSEEICSGEQK
jgi:hypothetical protein